MAKFLLVASLESIVGLNKILFLKIIEWLGEFFFKSKIDARDLIVERIDRLTD